MQSLPCSNCSTDMVGHSEPQRPVSVSFYKDLFHMNTAVMCRKKIHTSGRFSVVVVHSHFSVETFNSVE